MRPHYIKHIRRQASKKQAGRCYYCNRTMTKNSQLCCTAEHLVARSDDGKDTKSNIVAACKFCNAMRHRLFPKLVASEYAVIVRTLVDQKKWHEQHEAWKSLA